MSNNKVDPKLIELAASILNDSIPLEIAMEGFSMYPCLRENDRAVLAKCSWKDIRKGDIIAFTQNGRLVAHRVIALNHDRKTLLAKGDKNSYTDPEVAIGNVIGKITMIKRAKKEMPVDSIRGKIYRYIALQINKPEILAADFYLKVKNTILHLFKKYNDIRHNTRFVLSNSRKDLRANLIIATAQGTLPFAIIFCIKLLVDVLTQTHIATSQTYFYLLLAVTAFFFLLNGLLAEANSYFSEKLGQSINRSVYKLLHHRHTEQQLSAYENPEKQNQIHRIVQEASYRPLKTINDLMLALKSGVSALLLTGIFISVRWYLVLILMLAVAPGIVVRLRMARSYYKLKESQSSGERVMYYYNRILTGFPFAKELRLFGFADYFRTLFHQTQDELYDSKLKVRRTELRKGIVAQLFAVILIFSTLAIVVRLSMQGLLPVGTVVLFLFAFQRGYSVINDLFRSVSQLAEDNVYLKDVVDFLQPDTTDSNPTTQPAPFSLHREIRFENVSFRYETSKREALSSINLTIPAGKTVALVGENGSGKTTFIKLLCGFYPPATGNIYFDDSTLDAIGPDIIRNHISAVFQDFALYNLSALENIALGNPAIAPDKSKARQAAEVAGIHDVIQQLPNGYDTLLGNLFKNGEELSIGQWQKIAIARAFYRDAPLILMDEPSSALDPKSEAQVIDGLKKLSEGKTAFIVSHRLSTIDWADVILFFEDGKIVEQGTHEELIARKGMYEKHFNG